MNHYEFTLKYAVPIATELSDLEQRLFESGCDDAIVGIGQKGRLAMHFSREAESAQVAVESALENVRTAVPTARLIEAAPDLVGISDMAELFSFSRQNMRKLLQTHMESFPLPLHEGRSSLWHLEDVLSWFEQHQKKPVDRALREIARVNCRTNVRRTELRL